MALNKKVREAEELADRAYREAYGKTEEAPNGQDAQKPTESAPANPDATAGDTTPAVNPNDETWEHKYKVLIGKYSAEVPRMAEQIRELKAKLEEVSERKPEPAQEPQLSLKSMTPEAVVEQFGEDFAAAVGAIAARIAEQQGNKVREEFAPRVEEVAERTARTARAEFMRDLTAEVPDWREIDVLDGFTLFLDEVDPLTGRSRRHFFNEADSQNNAVRVAGFFKAFKSKTVADPKPQVSSRMDIENQLAPPTAQKSDSQQAKKFWTQAEIRKFYQDQRRGLFTVEQARQIESDIFAAGREGRLAA